MIKGNIKNRLEYEDYIRSLKDAVVYPFCPIYRESRKIIRYYRIKKTREGRDYNVGEMKVHNLMSLIDRAVRVGGIVYAWFWEELIPEAISALPLSKAEWIVDAEEISKVFMHIPTRTLEAVLLKANASPEDARLTLKVHCQDDIAALTEQIAKLPLDSIFATYRLISIYYQICENFANFFKKNENDRVFKYYIRESLEVFETSPNYDLSLSPQQCAERVSDWCDSLNLVDEDFINNPERYIVSICLLLECVHSMLAEKLGESDPVPQTIREILDEDFFQYVCDYYVRQKGEEYVMSLLNRLLTWLNNTIGANIDIDEIGREFSEEGVTVKDELENLSSADYINNGLTRQYRFPTRITDNKVGSQSYKLILKNLYPDFGSKLYTASKRPISLEEFMCLFDAIRLVDCPSYNPPYYWMGDVEEFAAYLRLLYVAPQPKGLEKLIPFPDCAKSKSRSQWSHLKQGLGESLLSGVEIIVQKAVIDASGKKLAPVPLTRKK